MNDYIHVVSIVKSLPVEPLEILQHCVEVAGRYKGPLYIELYNGKDAFHYLHKGQDKKIHIEFNFNTKSQVKSLKFTDSFGHTLSFSNKDNTSKKNKLYNSNYLQLILEFKTENN